MEVSLAPTTSADRPKWAILTLLYASELAPHIELAPEEDGSSPHSDSAGLSWESADRAPFLIRAGGELAGFVIVERGGRTPAGAEELELAELFVRRRYRGFGVGARAAVLAFEAFRGTWTVRQVARNAGATAFWRKVIERYTGGRFIETVRDDARWRGPIQSFDNLW